MKPDERVVWIRAAPGRKIVQTIEPMPTGFSVTTQWFENGKLFRQDCEVAIREGVLGSGGAADFNGKGALT
jgi:hypothetical protein